MLNRILLPLDGSRLAETVMPHALACARAADSVIMLVHVLQKSDDHNGTPTVDPLDWHLRKMEAELYLEKVAALFTEAGAEVESALLQGEAAERITEFAQEKRADLVMMSSHGQSGLSSWNVSSVVQKVIQTTHTSVMIVPAYGATDVALTELRYRTIVAPLDGSRRAECVLPLLQTLGRLYNAQILLVTVVPRPEMPRRAPLSPEDVTLADQVVARNRAEAKKYLSQLQSRVSGNVTKHLLLGDNLVGTLHDFVMQQDVDLLIFSAHGYSGNGVRRYGSLVTSFITYGCTPLLIVQDLPPEEIRKTEAEVVFKETSESDMGVRTVVNAPAAP